MGRGETLAQRKRVERQANTSGHQEQGDGEASGPKPGFCWSSPTSVPWLPPLLNQAMLLAALCLGTLGLPPKQDQVQALPASLGAICFGDKPSRSREFTASPHPGRSVGSASREWGGRPQPSWMEGPLTVITLGGGGESGHADHESPDGHGSAGEPRSR